jgi:hypothetical protein
MLTVADKPIMLSVIMLSVFVLNVVAPDSGLTQVPGLDCWCVLTTKALAFLLKNLVFVMLGTI